METVSIETKTVLIVRQNEQPYVSQIDGDSVQIGELPLWRCNKELGDDGWLLTGLNDYAATFARMPRLPG